MATKTEITINHPLEDLLGIQSGTTQLPITQRASKLVTNDQYDEKDKEIEDQLQEVYDAAMAAFDDQVSSSEVGDPKYAARGKEVAALFLTAALNATKERALMKQHKDKIKVATIKGTGPKTLNQNLIVGDRNEILRHLMGASGENNAQESTD